MNANKLQAFASMANEIGNAQVIAYSDSGHNVSQSLYNALRDARETLEHIPARELWEAAKLANVAGKAVIEDELMRRAEAT